MTAGGRDNPGLPEAVWKEVVDPRRLAVVRTLDAVGRGLDPDFDRLTALAAAAFGAPVSLVSIIDADRQRFPSHHGSDMTSTPVGASFCAHGLATPENVLIVGDAKVDPRFSDNPLVTAAPFIRFYAGAPLSVGGRKVGSLCVLDVEPREEPSPHQVETLQTIAALASSLLALKEGTHSGALARAALVKEEKRRAIALEAASLSSWIWDVRTGRVECDESLPVLFGLAPRHEIAGKAFFRAIDQRDARRMNADFSRSITAGDDYFGEYRVRKIRPTRWLAARGRVVERDAAGNPTLVFGVNYDITQRKEAEERQRLLLLELNHRVKNTLATVQALASQTVRYAAEPREFLAAFSARLQALGAAHGLLSDREWRDISLRELVRLETQPFDDQDRSRIILNGADELLTPDLALGLGIVLHELASNALKYGALSSSTGTVHLEWRRTGRAGDRRLELVWKERGGPPVAPPARQGFGTILIRRSLAKVLSSEIRHEFRPDGVVAELSIPLEAP